MKKRFILLLFTLALLLTITRPVFSAENEKHTITMTVERFVLGGDFIIEPTVVEFTPNETTYADILEKVLREHNFTPVSEQNSLYGYYLEGIEGDGIDCGSKNIPDCIKKMLADMDIKVGANDEDGLYQFSYTSDSGWMYYINNAYVPVGMGNRYPKDGEVVRYMFTLCQGADLTGTNYNTGKTYYKTADKSDLVRYMGKINQDKARWETVDGFSDSYKDAVEIMATVDASQFDVNSILDELEDYEKDLPAIKETLTLNKTELTLEIGKTDKLFYTISPIDTQTTVQWYSDNNSVATVKDGLITGIGRGTTKIHAKTANGIVATCTVTVIAPSTPKPITVKSTTISKLSATSYNQLKLSWKKVSGVTGYELYRKTSSTSWKKLKGLTATSYTDKTVATGTSYSYKVRAYKTVGSKTYYSSYSNVKSGKTKLNTTTLTVKAGKKQASLSWKKVSGATGYEIVRATSKTGKFKKVATTKKTSYKNKSLTKKTYYYKVRAYRLVNKKPVYSAYSKVKSVKIK